MYSKIKDKTHKTKEEVLKRPTYFSNAFDSLISSSSKTKNFVFVFSGAGIRGLSYIPLINYFKIHNIKPNISVGTSAGAIASIVLMNDNIPGNFFSYLPLTYISRLMSNKFLLFKTLFNNKFKSFIDNSLFLSKFIDLLDESGIKKISDLNGAFGTFSTHPSSYLAFFGAYKNFIASKSLSLKKAISSSIAVPPDFQPVRLNKNTMISIFLNEDEFSNYSGEALGFDGAALQVLPFPLSISLVKFLFDKNLESTAFFLFNSAYSLLNENSINNLFDNIEAYSKISLENQLYLSILGKEEVPFVLFNLNYDGLMNGINYSDSEKFGIIWKRGMEFIYRFLKLYEKLI